MKSRVGFYWPQTLPLLFLLLVISRVSADVSTTTEIPKRTTESYLMGVSLFEGIRLSAENEYLTRSLPMILLASLKKLEARVISDREADGIRASIIRSALDAEYAKVSDALRTLDKGFFDAIADATKKKTEEDLQGRRDRIAFLRGMDRERIAVGERYPIVFIKKNLEGELLDLPIPEPEAFARANKLDLLVYGTVEEIAGYLYISIFLWNAAIGQPMPLFQAGGTSRGVQANLMASMNRIEAVVRGEKTGYLTVRTGQEDAVIEIDGQVIGVGRVNQFPLPAGVKLLSVSGASLVAVSQSCEIVEGRETMVELAVERRIVRYVPITTFPAGADVYKGGRWIGKTPFFHPYSGGVDDLLLVKEGYANAACALTPESGDSISITLQPSILDRETVRKMKKKEFYQAFGIFAVSIAVPLFCYGMAIDYASTYLTDSFYLWYRSYWATLAITSVLAVDWMISLAEYIQSVE